MVCTARLTRSLNLTGMLLASSGRPFENKPEPGGQKKKKSTQQVKPFHSNR